MKNIFNVLQRPKNKSLRDRQALNAPSELYDAIPESVIDILSQYPLNQHAHLNIDQQSSFCDPSRKYQYGLRETKIAAENGSRVVNFCHELGVQNYIIYLDNLHEGLAKAYGGLYLLNPKPQDILVKKTDNSAIKSSDLVQRLDKNNHKVFWLSGFNTSKCYGETASGLLTNPNYHVVLVENATADCLGFGARAKQNTLERLNANGAHIVTSQQMQNFFLKEHLKAYKQNHPISSFKNINTLTSF